MSKKNVNMTQMDNYNKKIDSDEFDKFYDTSKVIKRSYHSDIKTEKKKVGSNDNHSNAKRYHNEPSNNYNRSRQGQGKTLITIGIKVPSEEDSFIKNNTSRFNSNKSKKHNNNLYSSSSISRSRSTTNHDQSYNQDKSPASINKRSSSRVIKIHTSDEEEGVDIKPCVEDRISKRDSYLNRYLSPQRRYETRSDNVLKKQREISHNVETKTFHWFKENDLTSDDNKSLHYHSKISESSKGGTPCIVKEESLTCYTSSNTPDSGEMDSNHSFGKIKSKQTSHHTKILSPSMIPIDQDEDEYNNLGGPQFYNPTARAIPSHLKERHIPILSQTKSPLGVNFIIREAETVIKDDMHKLSTDNELPITHSKKSISPEFIKSFEPQTRTKEGKKVRFEALINPEADSSLKIDWYKDGKSMPIGSRHNIKFTNGNLVLEIDPCSKGDSGNYLCTLKNLAGSANASFNFMCLEDKPIEIKRIDPAELYKQHNLQGQIINKPDVVFPTFDYVNPSVNESRPKFPPAHFLTHITPILGLEEEGKAHFEAKFEPFDDPNIKSEWFKDGLPLIISPRILRKQECGYVVLNINITYPSDSGTYTCKIQNKAGSDETRAILDCKTIKPIKVESILPPPLPYHDRFPSTPRQSRPLGSPTVKPSHPSRFPSRLHNYIKPDEISRANFEKPLVKKPSSIYQYDQPYVEIIKHHFPAPHYITQFQSIHGLKEETRAHLEARYEPAEDPDIEAEWYKDGHPLMISSRIIRKISNGYISLDISSTFASDSGLYSCVIFNKAGRDQSQGYLSCMIDKPIRIPETPQIFESTTIHPPPPTQYNPSPSNIDIERYSSMSNSQIHPSHYNSVHKQQYQSNIYNNNSTNFQSFKPQYRSQPPDDNNKTISHPSPALIDHSAIYYYDQAEFVPLSNYGPPKFLTPFQNIANLKEGYKAHFEARLEPKDDPSLRVEWLFNGDPIIIGSRHHYIHDFGFVALDIYPTYSEDSGQYTCVATNREGQDFNTATISCFGGRSIITDSENPESLKKIKQLEKYQELAFTHQLGEEPDKKDYGSPILLTQLKDLMVYQGDRAHFEASYKPTDDSSMKIEWFLNGEPLKAGSRFKHLQDFGYIALDISDCYPVDTGIYTLVLSNEKGRFSTDVTLKVIEDRNIDFNTLNPDGLMKIKALESHLTKKKIDENDAQLQSIPPKFLSHIGNISDIYDGDTVHFEAKIVPERDPDLKVQWYFNGEPLRSGSRFKTLFNMGNIALDIYKVSAADNGIYECKVWNKCGEDSTQGTITCANDTLIDRKPINLESLREIQKMEAFHNKYVEMEKRNSLEDDIPVSSPAHFLTRFPEIIKTRTGDSVFFEAKLEPRTDPDLIVEWWHNDQPLLNSCRITPIYNFGYAALKISPVIIEDNGSYICVARNKFGQDSISATLTAIGDKLVDTDTLNPESLYEVRRLEAMYNISQKRHLTNGEHESNVVQECPRFLNPFGILKLQEGDKAILRAKIIPDKDPNLTVEWYSNGKPLILGDRHKVLNDFGYIGLSIKDITSNDNGIYLCKLSNNIGSSSMEGMIECIDGASVQTKSLNPESLSAIHRLEYVKVPKIENQEHQYGSPKFIKPLQGNFNDLKEGEVVRLEALYEPFDDPSLQIQILKNGKPILAGSRFRLINEFGIILLEISEITSYDSGIYEFILRNKSGESVSQVVLNCIDDKCIQENSLNPESLNKIKKLEEWEYKVFERGFNNIKNGELLYPAPHFLREFPPQIVLSEGQRLHLESRIEPKDDPSLTVEWLVNDKPLPAGDRFKTFRDFGMIALNILSMYSTDSGIYKCKVSNNQGSIEQMTQILCQAGDSIINKSILPGSKDIEALEATLNSKYATIDINEPTSTVPPKFTKYFNNKNVKEGQRVWFEGRLIPSRDPNMKILWLKDGKPLAASNRMNIINDFGFIALEITSVCAEDQGEYSCVASNPLGQAITAAKLYCQVIPQIISDSQYPRGESLLETLEKQPNGVLQFDDKPENTSVDIPRFVHPLPSELVINEDDNVFFEIQIEPPTDPNRIVKWYKNDQEIEASNRTNIVSDFGFVALYIKGVRVDDTGLYTCRAVNPLGEAMTSTNLIITGTENILRTSMMPDPEATLSKIRNLETWESIVNMKNGTRSKLSQRLNERHGNMNSYSQYMSTVRH